MFKMVIMKKLDVGMKIMKEITGELDDLIGIFIDEYSHDKNHFYRIEKK